MSDFFVTHGLQQARLPCPSLSLGVFSKSCPLSQWCHSTISSSVILFSSCPQSFPASGSFHWVGSSHQVARVLVAMVLSWIWRIGIFFSCVKQQFLFQNLNSITKYILRSLNFYPYPLHHSFSFWERLANNNLQATFGHLSLFVNEFLFEDILFCLCIVFVFFFAKTAKLSSCDRLYGL